MTRSLSSRADYEFVRSERDSSVCDEAHTLHMRTIAQRQEPAAPTNVAGITDGLMRQRPKALRPGTTKHLSQGDIMRVAIAGIGFLLVTATSAQAQPCASQAITYDPYKPSDLAIVRNYGGTVLAQAPVSTLLKLDPYVPSQGELLRQLGRGIPVWPAYPGYGYTPARLMPDCEPAPEAPPAPEASAAAAALTSFADVMAALNRERTAGPIIAPAPAVRGTPPEKNKGVWIQYAGRAWVSAGAAVPFRHTEFVRIGESAGVPVFRRVDTKDDLIFVATTIGMVAPFQAVP
jgi:hypothetical protein